MRIYFFSCRRDDPKPIAGKKVYDTTVYVNGDVATETLNGLNVSEDIVTTNTDQTIYGETIINDPVAITNDVDVVNVNGIDLSEQAIPLDSNKTIIGEKNLTALVRVNTINVEEHATVDGVDLSKLITDVLTIDGKETVQGYLALEETLTVVNNVVVNYINGVNVSDLYRITAKVNETTIFESNKRFTKLVDINGTVVLDGLLNGLNTSDIFTTTRPHYFTSSKSIYFLTANVIDVHGLVSGLNLFHDVVTLTTDQVITGNHYFTEGITVYGNIVINGTVDGVDISELRNRTIAFRNQTVIEGNITFYNTVNVTDYIAVNRTTNYFDLGDLFEDVVYDFEENVTIMAEKQFSSNLNCSDKFVVDGTVNGYNIPEDFVDVSSNQNISGEVFSYQTYLPISRRVIPLDDKKSPTGITEL